VEAVDDGSVEFELAAAVASLRGGDRGPGPFRCHIEPLVFRLGRWEWADTVPHEVVWSGRDVLKDMAAVLERRLVDSARQNLEPAVDGWVRAHPSAVAALLEGEVDLEYLRWLCEALALVDWSKASGSYPLRDRTPRRPRGLPPSYAILKLAFLGRPLRVGEVEVAVRPDQTTLGLLRAGDFWGATIRAARRLRGYGFVVRGIPRARAGAPTHPDPEFGRRLLAALLVPVLEGPLVNRVLAEEEIAEEGGV
jgi:CRISPR-associated protein Csx17